MHEEQSEQTVPETGAAKKRAGALLFDIMDILESGIITVFVFILIFAYLIRTVGVDGSSMYPTLHDGDRMLVLQSFTTPDCGKIVVIDDQYGAVFTDAAQEQTKQVSGLGIVIVKRLIAKGGQEIDIDFDTGAVYVDGVLLDEPYTADPTTRNDGAFNYPFTVPEGYVFVMGDNRLHSTDSRNAHVALVPEDQMFGVVLLRYGRETDESSSWLDQFELLW